MNGDFHANPEIDGQIHVQHMTPTGRFWWFFTEMLGWRWVGRRVDDASMAVEDRGL